ncbi:MAG: alpha/beta fold hydrolase [Myxococcales bacterium]|nr:alpha/beta fold hydrolase [Myxococcales bacterium]
MTRIEIATDDGTAPAFVYGEQGAPNALMFMDGLGMRPAMHAIAERLAASGYYVLLPDVFYRAGAYTPPDPTRLFSDPEVRGAWFKTMSAAASQEKLMRDTRHYLAHLPREQVAAFGYCMGGRMAVAAAGTYPDRIALAAAFHPGGLATDAADSPHLLAASIKAKVYVAAASDDASFDEAQQERFSQAMTAAGVSFELETYAAKHGWVPTDTPVHDPDCAEKHWAKLLDLLVHTLR